MMKKLIFLYFLLGLLFVFPIGVYAQGENSQELPEEEFLRADVIEIVEEGEKNFGETPSKYQLVRLKIQSSSELGETIVVEHGGQISLTENQLVKKGDQVVLVKYHDGEGYLYQIIDRYRLGPLIAIALFFFVLVVLISRWHGVGSLIGMIISLLVIVFYIVPQILDGRDPLFVTIAGGSFIILTSMYLAHGLKRQTTIAILGMILSLIATGFCAIAFSNLTLLTGLGSDDANALRFGATQNLNFKGLLLAGIMIGALGVMDDITTSLSATISELKKANPKLTQGELFKSGLTVGQEHIVSLVNTLVLAYAGAALPIFLFIVLNPGNVPLWLILNSELLVEEIVRTLAGSVGLILAVPITAYLASKFTKIDQKQHTS